MLYGIANLVGFSFVRAITPELIFGEVFQVVFYIGSTHFFRLIIKKRDWFDLPFNRLIPRMAGGILLMSAVNSSINYIIVRGITSRQATDLIALLIVSMIVYFLWSLIYFTYHYFESYRKSLQHKAALNEIELSNLKSQLNPHFIFNALNSIRALVDEDPEKSKDAITQLSHILRNSLAADKKRLVSFDEEMKTVRDYLALESIRYEERLKTKLNIHPDSEACKIPPLMIQTLVENGIKHGISNLKKGGIISIDTTFIDSAFVIQIRNSGVYINGVSKNAGMGLENTRRRLKLIYGDQVGFEIRNEDKNIVLTEIKIPEKIKDESINYR